MTQEADASLRSSLLDELRQLHEATLVSERYVVSAFPFSQGGIDFSILELSPGTPHQPASIEPQGVFDGYGSVADYIEGEWPESERLVLLCPVASELSGPDDLSDLLEESGVGRAGLERALGNFAADVRTLPAQVRVPGRPR